jgi:hypothetical protein
MTVTGREMRELDLSCASGADRSQSSVSTERTTEAVKKINTSGSRYTPSLISSFRVLMCLQTNLTRLISVSLFACTNDD